MALFLGPVPGRWEPYAAVDRSASRGDGPRGQDDLAATQATRNLWAAFGARPYGAFPPATPNSAVAFKEVVHGAALVAILFSVLVVILFIPEHLLD